MSGLLALISILNLDLRLSADPAGVSYGYFSLGV